MSNPKQASATGAGDPAGVDPGRRTILLASCAAGGAATAAVAWPFVSSLQPSEKARAAGAPVEADITGMAPGEQRVFEWRGKPVWVLRRTPEMLASLKAVESKLADPQSKKPNQPDYAKNENRSSNPEYMVVVGICTHLGCSPSNKAKADPSLGADWPGGFFCPCHGSRFDYAGRVYSNMPAPENLIVPPYKFLADGRLLIGEETTGA
jgi:ubiquinol-cytochrome c reductase iron-sulfur subunit